MWERGGEKREGRRNLSLGALLLNYSGEEDFRDGISSFLNVTVSKV